MKVRIGSVPSLTIATCSINSNRTLTKNNVTICTQLPIIARFPITGFVINRFSIITLLLLLPSMAIKSRNPSIVVQASSNDHHFKVVACLSESSSFSSSSSSLSSSTSYTAQQIQNALSSWQSKNEKIQLSSGEVVEGRNVAMSISTVSVGNDTSSVLPLLCDAIEIYNPSLILSFLDPSSLFLVQTAASTSAVPLLTWSRGYRQPSFHHDQVSSCLSSFFFISSSLSSFFLLLLFFLSSSSSLFSFFFFSFFSISFFFSRYLFLIFFFFFSSLSFFSCVNSTHFSAVYIRHFSSLLWFQNCARISLLGK